MAEGDTERVAPLHVTPMRLCRDACDADNVALMDEAIALATKPDSGVSVEEVLHRGVWKSASKGALHVLERCLQRGANIESLSPDAIMPQELDAKPSLDVLELLVRYGWDVNNRGPKLASPLLQQVATYHDLVVWCLEHGARVDVPPDPVKSNPDGSGALHTFPIRPTILGTVAAGGSVETFELLRAKAAPLDPRTLHLAVKSAVSSAPGIGAHANRWYEQRMQMIHHLVDVVKLDVNATESQVAALNGTPLCYLAWGPRGRDYRELIFFLLQRGADPDHAMDGRQSAMSHARNVNNEYFLRTVLEWQASHSTVV